LSIRPSSISSTDKFFEGFVGGFFILLFDKAGSSFLSSVIFSFGLEDLMSSLVFFSSIGV